ncbi:cytochrome b/b6 domain-containing protein [Shewanella sp. WXL01]|uniref:cytochrome b/b6 domain-containing protein n=1 Tax=Shewanella sp. WXL01 TaxID=2709721 RepID=UPI0014384322|nr:cytochrome b/b6 domain-containing protein [Shewanella sp. WXL01]NKF49592.1 cytochrome b/b6 domain-containing protein [Shewanella sp. WXL01]
MKLPRFFSVIGAKLHIIMISTCAILLPTSGWLLIGKQLRVNASIWDYVHVYLGTITAILGLCFVLKCCIKGGWRQFFPWLVLDLSQFLADVKGLFKAQLPSSGGKGLLSIIEGIGLLLLAGVCISGLMWVLTQGDMEALTWRKYHVTLAEYFVTFVAVHMVLALVHVIEMIKNS